MEWPILSIGRPLFLHFFHAKGSWLTMHGMRIEKRRLKRFKFVRDVFLCQAFSASVFSGSLHCPAHTVTLHHHEIYRCPLSFTFIMVGMSFLHTASALYRLHHHEPHDTNFHTSRLAVLGNSGGSTTFVQQWEQISARRSIDFTSDVQI